MNEAAGTTHRHRKAARCKKWLLIATYQVYNEWKHNKRIKGNALNRCLQDETKKGKNI
jgi:hypothetical protein